MDDNAIKYASEDGPLRLCIECRYYRAGRVEVDDKCLHQKSQHDGVREIKLHACGPMRAGICGKEARYFLPKETEVA